MAAGWACVADAPKAASKLADVSVRIMKQRIIVAVLPK
jgi:hypothetical protein